MTFSGHRVLVVEDDPSANVITCRALRSLGDSPRAAATVEEALAAIAEEEFCYFVFDQQLPLDADDPTPLITGGERVTVAARRSDPRHVADREGHVTPILALTGYSTDPQFVAGLFKRGIDAFVVKDVCDNIALFSREVREMLEKAGRGEHAKCAALARRALKVEAGAALTPAVRIAIRGNVSRSGRTEIAINGAVREMQDSRLAILLRCIVARDRSLEAWTSRSALGIGESRSATTQIRQTFEGLVPPELEVLEGDRRGNFRLNPAVVVENVDFDALAQHPDPGVVRIAQEWRKRR